jgi:hypothetical protein
LFLHQFLSINLSEQIHLTAGAGTLVRFPGFPFGNFSAKEISMDHRDWELLDKQLRGSNCSWRNDSLTIWMVVAVFLAGIAFGGIVFTPENKPIRIASNHTAAMACDYNGACRIRSHPPAASTLTAL